MRKLSILVCLILATTSLAGTVYKKVNPDGSVEFTDKPAENTVEVEIRTPSTMPGHPSSLPVPSAGTQDQHYQLEILKPRADEILVDNDGKLTLLLSVSPVLRVSDGDQIKVSFADRIQLSGSKTVVLENIPRGTNTIEAVVIDRLGVVMSDTASVRFHVKRYTQLTPPKGDSTTPLNPPRPAAPTVSPTNPPKPPLPPVSPTRPPKP